MNTKKQGDVGLGACVAWATSLGYTVSLPLTDSQPYDLIVDDGSLKRVQVKTTSYAPNGCYKVSLTVKGGNRSSTGKIKKLDPSTVDAVFVMCQNHDKFLIPIEAIAGQQMLTLTAKYVPYMV
jgi:hypothetical protein